MFKRVLLVLLLSGASCTWAQTAAIQGFCDLGGTPAKTSGLNSTNNLQGIIPSCTVTVYLTGTTTLATIYANAGGTPLSNPFTASATGSVAPGQWIFWTAINQGYDIVMSGGIPPNTYPQPVTLVDQFPGFEFTYINAGCVGPLPTDATSTNCGNGNLVGNTATRVQTFGYTNANNIANASAKAFFGAGNLTANGLSVLNPILGAGYDNFLIGTIPAADVTLQDAYAFGNENVNLSGTSTHFSANVLLAEGFDNLCSSNPGNATFNDDYFFGENIFCYTANGGTVNVSNVLAMGDTVANTTIGTGTLTLNQMVALGNQTGEFGNANGTDTTHDIVAIGSVSGIGDNDSYLNAIGSSTLGFVENSHNINANGYLVGGGLTNSHDLFLNGDTILNGATHNALVNGIAIGYDVLPQTAAASLTDFICQGDNSCASVTGGSDFVAIGKTAGGSDATGSNWVSLGDGSGATGAAYSNWAAIGPNAHVAASNQMTLGNSSMTSLNLFGTGSGSGFLYSSGNAVSLQAGQIAPVNQVYYYCQATGMHCDARGSLITTGMALDGVTNSTTTFTSATANFTSADVGKLIILAQGSAATTVPDGTTISSVTNSTTVVMSNAASATATGVQWTVGTDDTTAAQSLLNSVATAGGGVIAGSVGKISLITGTLNLPTTGVALGDGVYAQNPIVIDGLCPVGTIANPLTACFSLDMTGAPASATGKLNTYGHGNLTIRNMAFDDTASDCDNYFLYTTNTTLYLNNNNFTGDGPGGANSCSYGVRLGGTDTTQNNGTTSAFGGYHTIIEGNTFQHMAHLIDGFNYANQIRIADNSASSDSGSPTAGDAFVNFTGCVSGTGGCTSGDQGEWITDNLFETTHMTYDVRLKYTQGSYLLGNSTFDGNSYQAYLDTGSDTTFSSCGECGKGNIDPSSPGADNNNVLINPGGVQIGKFTVGNTGTTFYESNGSTTSVYVDQNGNWAFAFGLRNAPTTYAAMTARFACNSANEGLEWSLSDANTGTWGATITAGGGTNHVKARCNGTNWVVD